jgi:hypothetical protein
MSISGVNEDLAAPGYTLEGLLRQEMVEGFWRMLKQGRLRLKDDFDDDDSPFVQEVVTPGQRARARVIGAKLFAIRQHLRRTARTKAEVKRTGAPSG